MLNYEEADTQPPEMLRRLLRLKFKRSIRVLKQTPPIAFVVLLTAAVGVGWFLCRQFPLTPNRYIFWALSAVVLTTAHRGRRDANFCRLTVPHAWRLFAVEYTLCFSPLVVLSVVASTWDNACFYLLCPLCVALLPTRRAGAFGTRRNNSSVSKILWSVGPSGFLALPTKKIPPFLGVRSLELVSFVRRRFVVLLIWTFFLKLSSPALLLYAVFNPSTAFLVLAPVVVSAVGIALSVLVKYALYNPENRKVDVPLAAAVGMAGIIIPPFLPVTLLMPWAYYGAARENLNRYLHAYNR